MMSYRPWVIDSNDFLFLKIACDLPQTCVRNTEYINKLSCGTIDELLLALIFLKSKNRK